MILKSLKIHRKTPGPEFLFFNKVVGLKPVTLLEKGLWHIYFSVNFANFSRILFHKEHLWQLLLLMIDLNYWLRQTCLTGSWSPKPYVFHSFHMVKSNFFGELRWGSGKSLLQKKTLEFFNHFWYFLQTSKKP